MTRLRSRVSRSLPLLAAAALGWCVPGCSPGFSAIDASVERLLLDSTEQIGDPVVPRRVADLRARVAPEDQGAEELRDPTAETIDTRNPPAGDLSYTVAGPEGEAEVIERLRGYGQVTDDVIELQLEDALVHAVAHSREFRFQEETYLLAAMRLLIERHLWGPRFFNDVLATVTADGDDGLYDTSLQLVNDLRVTQRLPYGGEISARALAVATEDLHQRVAGENVQSAEIILAADIPLMRGAGTAAREDRIQAERDLVYAARDFARFRREFLFAITRDYLDLIVSQQQIDNAKRTVESFQRLEARQQALYQAGRATPFAYAEARNETLDAEDRLVASAENYRLSLDRFKVRIGLPVEQAVTILPDSLDLPAPLLDIESSVAAAFRYRLDLQTSRDQVDDAVRGVDVAKNGLLADLDVFAEASLPTNDDRGRAGLDFEPDDASFSAGVSLGLPLDRTIEKLNVRQSEIALERARRAYDEFRDSVSINVRGAVRAIDSALFSYQLQVANVEIAQQREASIKADPARATIQQQTDAINQTSRAVDARDSARRNLEVAILAYLLETGTLRVGGEGRIERIAGMGDPGAE